MSFEFTIFVINILVIVIMKTTKEYLLLLRTYKLQSAIRYGISRIGIFGSVARGEQQEGSDVDVYVELSSPDLFCLYISRRNYSNFSVVLSILFACGII